MSQTKITLEEAQPDCRQADLDRQCLEASATVYAEVYRADPDLRQLTEAALTEWPE
jgi:hypothetical protein